MAISRPSTGDVVAGVSVALVALPQSLAYAELAGLPPQYGLYALALPALLAALFVSSPYLQTGPVALTSLLTFGALESLADEGSAEYVKLAALLALLVGLTRMILGLVRLGSVAYLLSEPVLLGFTTGAAILIVSSQLPKVFDYTPDDDGVLADAVEALVNIGDWSWSAIGFAVLTWVFMFGGRRVHKLVPGVLLAVIAGVLVSSGLDYDGSLVGDLDSGFIPFTLSFEWGSFGDLIVPAIAIALVGFAEPASIARTFAAEERMPWDANREMFSQGVANVAAGVSGAFPVGGSFSRSSLNKLAGATSPWAGAISGAFVLVAFPLIPLIEDLPRAVLGAVVIGAVIKLIQLRELLDLVRSSLLQGFVGFGTLAATLATAPRVERGVIIGIGLAIASHLWRELQVSTSSERHEDTLWVFPHGVLWFATVPDVERLIREELAEHPDIEHVVIDLSGVGRLDYSGAAALSRIFEELELADVDIELANVRPGSARAVQRQLARVRGANGENDARPSR